ncbi:Oxidoreductase [Neofusicoccum parvum]|nr:Oxidoreductase [Neofusicoccum parvum]
MATPKNTAAWLESEKAYPLVVKDAPYPTLTTPNSLIIKTTAIAFNPVDHALQSHAMLPLPYPWILGCDAAGTVVAAAPAAAATYPPGTRVAGLCPGFDAKDPAGCAFQSFVRLEAPLVTALPPNVSDVQAVALPLALGTAAAGLFGEEQLRLGLPGRGGRGAALVWGAATSVGSCAVQLAVNAGYEVVATAGRANAEYARRLGAAVVFDYKAEGVVEEVVKAFEGREFVGVYDAASTGGAIEACLEIAARVKTDGRRFVSSVRWLPEGIKVPEGVETAWMWGTSPKDTNVGPAIFQEFLPAALEDGRFIPAPEPLVVGEGLESVQKALDVLKEGVSAKKVVVTL